MGSSVYPRTSSNPYCKNLFSTLRVPSIFTTKLSTTAFYGPRKFVAIKPKELVIADDGIAIYVDSNKALCYKNVNRIVTVDLERFAISSSASVPVKFETTEQSDFKRQCLTQSGDVNFFSDKGENGGELVNSLYFAYNGEIGFFNPSSDTWYLCIPCKDE